MGPNYIKLVGVFPTVVDMNPGIKTNNGELQPYLRGVDIIKAVVSVLVPCRATSFCLSNGGDVPVGECGLTLRVDSPVMPNSWTRNTHIETYVSEGCKVWIKNDSVLVSMSERCLAPWARLASAFPMLFPSMFKNAPLTADETRLLQLLSKWDLKKGEDDEFERLCDLFYKKLDTESWMLKKSVRILASGNAEKRIQETRDFIRSREEEIDSLQRKINNYIDVIREQELILIGLMSKSDGGLEEELVDFLHHSNITIDTSSANGVTITVRTVLGCYEEGEVEAYVLNNKQALTGNSGNWDKRVVRMPYTQQQMKQFYKAVFDHKIDIKIAASYKVTSLLSVDGLMQDGVIDPDYINNPNIGQAGCLGGYSGDLAEAKRHSDPMAILSICQQSASSVNLGEVWPMAVVTCELVESTGKVIRTENGDITFKDAMEMILREEEKA